MANPSSGGDSPTNRDPSTQLQPVPIDSLKWAGEPWDKEREVGDFEYVDGRPAYVKDQVIVTGRVNDVKAVVSEALGHTETLRDPINLSPLLPPDALRRFPAEDESDVIIDLYHTGNLSVREAVVRIYRQAEGAGKAVFADPNYVTGHPHIPVGSPHIPVGSPHIPVGSPDDLPVAAQVDFWEQWAFAGQWGIGLTAGGQRLVSLGHTGQQICVAIFDTSPFSTSGPKQIPWITPPLDLNVTHLLARPQAREGSAADHGLFVAGLIHAVAPKSQIHLIQVLNEQVLGDLDNINLALCDFMLQRLSEHTNTVHAGTMNNTVMNLSLGFLMPSNLADLDLEVVCLEIIMLGARLLGATVVAAAGNESSPQVAEPAQAPAAYSSVIGAMASTRAGTRACFSNEGDVVAPGGDSNIDMATNTCANALTDICTNGLISLVLNTVAPLPNGPSGYGCWAGTSFSAPLVSGLAALVLERRGPQPLAGVLADLTGGATTGPVPGLDIINVPGSLGLP